MPSPPRNQSNARAPGALHTLLAFLFPALLFACAHSPDGSTLHPHANARRPPRNASLKGADQRIPEWVTRGCRAYWTRPRDRESISCATGIALASRNPITTRETAIARARAALARNVEVTIESFVRLDERGENGNTEVELRSIIHQLTSTSLPGAQLEALWESEAGEIHALVSLHVAKVQHSVHSAETLPAALRADWALRAEKAFEYFSTEQARSQKEDVPRIGPPAQSQEETE